MSTGDTLAWLLGPDEPSVRYFTLRDLLGRPEEDQEVTEAKHVIEIVDTLQGLGVRHEAVDEGLRFILGKRKPDGRWKLGYTTSRSSTYANFGQRGKPSKWITLRALKVLKNAGMVALDYSRS